MDASLGFEPKLKEPKTFVLPLHKEAICCGGRTRTAELERGQIYSLLSLPLDYTTICGKYWIRTNDPLGVNEML